MQLLPTRSRLLFTKSFHIRLATARVDQHVAPSSFDLHVGVVHHQNFVMSAFLLRARARARARALFHTHVAAMPIDFFIESGGLYVRAEAYLLKAPSKSLSGADRRKSLLRVHRCCSISFVCVMLHRSNHIEAGQSLSTKS